MDRTLTNVRRIAQQAYNTYEKEGELHPNLVTLADLQLGGLVSEERIDSALEEVSEDDLDQVDFIAAVKARLADHIARVESATRQIVPLITEDPRPMVLCNAFLQAFQVECVGTGRRLLGSRFVPTLVHDDSLGILYRYTDRTGWNAWTGLPKAIIEFLDRAQRLNPDGSQTPVGDDLTKRRLLRETVLAMVPNHPKSDFPCWMGEEDDKPDLDEWIAVRNGRVNLRSGELAGHTPELVTLDRMPIEYDPEATAPTWLDMLDRVQPDKEAIVMLQRWFGYSISSGPSIYQKGMWLHGRPRSGKGTIIRVLEALMNDSESGKGQEKGLARTGEFSNFGTSHALEDLLGARLLTFPDVKVDGYTRNVVVGRLLSILGNDALSINPKNKPMFSTRLRTRVLLASNKLPRSLADSYGGLVARLMFFETKGTWKGREDTTLEARLMNELPGILNWSIQGWRDLQEHGFPTPASSEAVKTRFQAQGSVFDDFIAEDLIITGNPKDRVDWKDIRSLYRSWSAENEPRARPMGELGDHLRALDPIIEALEQFDFDGKFPCVRVGGSQRQFVPGIQVKKDG